MKAFITPACVFTPGATEVGTIEFTGIPDFEIGRLIAVINQTHGRIIYSTASPLSGFSAVATDTITLKVDTSEMDDTDLLQVVYEVPDTVATEAKQDDLIAIVELLANQETLEALVAKFGSIGQKTSAGSTPVVLSEEQELLLGSIIDKLDALDTNTTGRVFYSVSQATGSATISAPAGAKGFVIQNSAKAEGGLRFTAGVPATNTVGYYLEIGQSTSYIDGAPTGLNIWAVDSAVIDCAVLWFN